MTDTARDRVLLLHGQPGSARDWDGVIAALDSGLSAVAIDRPGWDGRSHPTDLDGNADAALAALDRTGAGRATVVGHSFGAAVAAWLAVRDPDRVGALVLAAPSVNVASLYAVDRWLAAPGFGDAAGAAGLGGLGIVLKVGVMRRWIARRFSLDAHYLAAAGDRLSAPSAWRAFVHEQRVLTRGLPILERRLREIAVPTAIVAGTRDYVVRPGAVRALAGQVPAAEVRWLPGAGHLLPLRQPGALAAIVSDSVTPNRGPARARPA